jgi:hypothetical protein
MSLIANFMGIFFHCLYFERHLFHERNFIDLDLINSRIQIVLNVIRDARFQIGTMMV